MSYKCVVCDYPKTIVVDSRAFEFRDRTILRRRRKCVKCGFKENSFEVPEADFEELNNETKELREVYEDMSERSMRAFRDFLDVGIKQKGKIRRQRNREKTHE